MLQSLNCALWIVGVKMHKTPWFVVRILNSGICLESSNPLALNSDSGLWISNSEGKFKPDFLELWGLNSACATTICNGKNIWILLAVCVVKPPGLNSAGRPSEFWILSSLSCFVTAVLDSAYDCRSLVTTVIRALECARSAQNFCELRWITYEFSMYHHRIPMN